ncbi:hypothetical protein HG537_0D05220 [Torulaspora globosa]|uniref:Uncharacterized protein n=1 Tax=Torulaspora globosa TaxID=48254 RepID=A0A7H9HVW4_9SACH|nr:hypothetical protein HG537_0D05220 [Torulaspora sp. CBS 2947]
MCLSRARLEKLCSSLIGDQTAKIDLLVNSEAGLLDDLADFGGSNDTQDVKLDIWFTALRLEEYIRDELGDLYIGRVNRVFQERSLALNLVKNSCFTDYKYMRLINLCVELCESCVYPHVSLLREGLTHLISRRGVEKSVDDLATIVELLTFFLREKETRDSDIELLYPLENLLREIVGKYAGQLQFNYAIRVKISKSPASSAKYDPFSNKGLELNNTIPNAVSIDNPLERSLLSLSLTLYSRLFQTLRSKLDDMPAVLWRDIHFCIFVTSLLKSGDISLRCAALTFLIQPYFMDENAWSQKQRLHQALPYLVDCLNFQPLPWWFDPFDTLNSLIELYHRHEPSNNPVIIFLSETNMMYGLLTLFADCLSLKYQNKYSLRSTTRFIKLCASFAAYDELYRSLLLEQKSLLNHLEFGLERHLGLLEEFLARKQILFDSLDENSGCLPPLYDSELAMAWLLLLKSFSRSVSALRTSLKRNRLAELLLDLVRVSYRVLQECKAAGEDFLTAEIDIMSVTLGCICNFVVEFSNLQSLISNNGIVAMIGDILRDPLFNSKQADSGQAPMPLQASADKVKTNALWVLRHLMYNCRNPEKLDLLSKIPMSKILEFINDPSWPVQEQCFELIRNLTCNSRRVVNILLENFRDITYETDTETSTKIAKGTTYLFQFLARKIKLIDPTDNIQKRTLIGVLYIIVNLVAVNENKKQLVIEQDEILDILRDILSESQQDIGRYANDSKLKLASLWILNNLLWNVAITHYTHHALEGYTLPHKGDESSQPITGSPFASETGVDISTEAPDDEDDEDIDDDLDDADDEDDDEEEEFVHDPISNAKARSRAKEANEAAVRRCKKLVEIGIYDLVKKNVFDESLSVREKARTLQYHMDLLLKDS